MARFGPGSGALLRRHLALERAGHERTESLTYFQQRRKSRAVRKHQAKPVSHDFLDGRALDLVVDNDPADVRQAAVAHAGRAGGLAGAAGETAIQMELSPSRRGAAFQHLLDEIDASPGTVQLVTEELIGRAGGGAEAAVHALAQDPVGLPAFGRILDERGEIGLHDGC